MFCGLWALIDRDAVRDREPMVDQVGQRRVTAPDPMRRRGLEFLMVLRERRARPTDHDRFPLA